jgi:hypothetical protein
MSSVLQCLGEIQRRFKVPLMVIGGWAVQGHGYSRNTVDVDCMIATDSSQAMQSALAHFGFEEIDSFPQFTRFKQRSGLYPLLDVMFVSADIFRRMSAQGKEITLDGAVLLIPSLHHLFALKLHAIKNNPDRAKDVEDIRQLILANPGVVTADSFKELCEKFGPPDYARHFQHLKFHD